MWARATLATAFLALGLAGPAAAGRYAPSVAFDGTSYLVVWQEQRPGAGVDIYAARVSEAGVVLDPLGIPISKAAGNQWAPAVAFDGTSFLVVWQDDRSTATGPDLYGGRVSSAGVLLDPGGIPISTAPGAQLMPAVARAGASSLVVWTEGGAGSDIRGARVSPAGAVLDPSGLAVSTASGAQLNPAVAFGSSSSLVVWDDYRAGSADLYGARVTEAGALLDPAGIAIASGADSQWNGAAAFDGTSFLVGWDSYAAGVGSDVQARRVSTSGTVLGSGPVAVAAAPGSQARPALALRRRELPVRVAGRSHVGLRHPRRARDPGRRRAVAGRDDLGCGPGAARRSRGSWRRRIARRLGGQACGPGLLGHRRVTGDPVGCRARPCRDPDPECPRPAARRRRGSRGARADVRPPAPRPSASARARRARRSSAGSTAARGARAARRGRTAASSCGRTRSRFAGATAPGTSTARRRAGAGAWTIRSPGSSTWWAEAAGAPGPARCAATPSRSRTASRSTAAQVADTIARILGRPPRLGRHGPALLPACLARGR